METFTVSFFGHRQIYNSSVINKKLEKIIYKLLIENEYVEFLIGRNGEFDILVSSIIHMYKRNLRSDNSAHILILPYITSDYMNNKNFFDNYYDEIEICGLSAKKHFKSAYQIRNKSMVDRSDLIIFYIEHNWGVAYKTMNYAKKTGKKFINIFEE